MRFGDVVDFGMDGKKQRLIVIGESSRAPGCVVLSDRGLIRHTHPSNCQGTGGDRLILARQLRKRYEGRFPGRLVEI